MTIGSNDNEREERKLRRLRALVEDTFFRTQQRVDRGELSFWPWQPVEPDAGGGPKYENEHTKELDERYERAGYIRPIEGSHYITSWHPDAVGDDVRPLDWKPSNSFRKPALKGRAKYGFCPDCGYYLSLKGSCCPTGKMYICLECGYTRTYEGE